MIKLHHVVALFLVTLFLSFVFFTGCEEEVERVVTEVVRDTITVTETDTVILEIISVDQVNASPDSIAQGGSITLTVDVTKSPMAGDLTYAWFAEAGTFDNTEFDTVTWKAPDGVGAYRINVHVTDGDYIAIGNTIVGVGMYAPTVTPYHVGLEACVCHAGQQGATWPETGHAEAWAGLQSSSHAASYCEPCHTVDDFPSIAGNAGYDDVPIEKFQDVQCESCHGPGSAHVAGPAADNINKSYDAQNCGNCHEGAHHPYLSEWEQSPHGFEATPDHLHGAVVNSFCDGCHEGVASAIRLSGDLSTFYGGGPVGRPDTTEVGLEPVTCATCHDPHSAENPGQLRSVADVPLVTANGESPVISEGGAGKLCMHCHHARRAPEPQIQDGYPHFGPHANPQADMVKGASAYHAVAAPDFVWATPSHLLVQNSCKTCHLPTVEFTSDEEPAETGHRFLPTVAACKNCHGVISSFRDIPALEDFDGNGMVEGVQDEVEGLLENLYTVLVDSFAARGVVIDDVDELLDSLGSVTGSSFKMREAGYNYAFVHDDKSLGIHNPDYAVQLLQQSILYLTNGTALNNAIIVREENAVVRKW